MVATFKRTEDVLAFRRAIGLGSFEDAPKALRGFSKALEGWDRGYRDPEALKGFLKSGLPDEMQDFLKTFESNAAGITDVLGLLGGAALTVQSLDQTLASLVQTESDYEFLNSCARVDVTNTLLEYNVVRSWHRQRRANALVGETSDPQFDDPVIQRLSHNIAFMAAGYSSSRVLPVVKTTEDPEGVLQMGALHTCLETAAHLNWYGNRDVNSLEFSGWRKTLEDEGRVLDAEGQLPDIKTIKGLTEDIRAPGFGLANEFWMSLGTKKIWDSYIIDNNIERHVYSDAQSNPYLGHRVPGIADENAKNGGLLFRSDIWLDRHREGVPEVWNDATKTFVEGSEGTNAPGTPSATATNAGAVLGSKWKAGDVNATAVSYRIVAGNNEGRSAASAPVTEAGGPIAAGEAINLSIAPDATGAATTFFDVYRETVPGNGVYRFMVRIARAPGATTALQDINSDRPGTEIGIIGDFNSSSASNERRTYALAQLLPAMVTKFPQGVVSLRKIGGMIEWYAGLRIYAPTKFFLVKNLPTS